MVALPLRPLPPLRPPPSYDHNAGKQQVMFQAVTNEMQKILLRDLVHKATNSLLLLEYPDMMLTEEI